MIQSNGSMHCTSIDIKSTWRKIIAEISAIDLPVLSLLSKVSSLSEGIDVKAIIAEIITYDKKKFTQNGINGSLILPMRLSASEPSILKLIL